MWDWPSLAGGEVMRMLVVVFSQLPSYCLGLFGTYFVNYTFEKNKTKQNKTTTNQLS